MSNTDKQTAVTPNQDGVTRSGSSDSLAGNLADQNITISEFTFRIITEWVFITHTNARQQEIQTLFSAAGIDKWQLLHGMKDEFLKNFVGQIDATLPELNKIIYRGWLFEVLRYGSISGSSPTIGMTYNDMLIVLRAQDRATASTTTTTPTDPDKSGPDSELKTRIPEFPKFSGVSTSFYVWKEQVLNLLTSAALQKSVTDSTYHQANPKISTAIFGALSVALSTGLARNHPKDLQAQNNSSAYVLFAKLNTPYNTLLTH